MYNKLIYRRSLMLRMMATVVESVSKTELRPLGFLGGVAGVVVAGLPRFRGRGALCLPSPEVEACEAAAVGYFVEHIFIIAVTACDGRSGGYGHAVAGVAEFFKHEGFEFRAVAAGEGCEGVVVGGDISVGVGYGCVDAVSECFGAHPAPVVGPDMDGGIVYVGVRVDFRPRGLWSFRNPEEPSLPMETRWLGSML